MGFLWLIPLFIHCYDTIKILFQFYDIYHTISLNDKCRLFLHVNIYYGPGVR